MTDPAIEAMARAIMITRPNGGCIVQDWGKEARDNPHVETALKQAQAALTAYHAHLEAAGFAVVPVEPTEAMDEAGWLEIEYPPREIYRAMIAAAKPEND